MNKINIMLFICLLVSTSYANQPQIKEPTSWSSSVYSSSVAAADFINRNARGIMLGLLGVSFLKPSLATYQPTLATATALSFFPADLFWGGSVLLAAVNYRARTDLNYAATSSFVSFNSNPLEISKNTLTSLAFFIKGLLSAR